jgi:hypothetical protein
VAGSLPFLTATVRDPLVLALLPLIYAFLVVTMALTAVFSSKPARRKAALEVLGLILPGRRAMPSGAARAGIARTRRRSAAATKGQTHPPAAQTSSSPE